ncbi:MAG TPA: sigma-70 family RNA polymerase sigma factor [Planctomycetota bacterium]
MLRLFPPAPEVIAGLRQRYYRREVAAAELNPLFAAFRRTRDPQLLSTLFERTAPWLLHRARLLLGRPSLAEDVVQDLFLALLENGHGCDPDRPCLPYLLGMLHRRAARVRRNEARTLAQSLREAATPGAPVDSAISAEGCAAVRTAIDSLPEPYREVVRRYAAQQTPRTIGRELGRTPNSVRVQLHRGLRILRSTLPPGLAVLLWTLPAQQLPAQAPARPSARRPLQLGAAAAVLAAVSVATWLVVSGGRADAAAVTTVANVAPAAAAPEPAGVLAGTAPAPVRTQADAAASRELVLELRHADGTPAASVGVLAHPAGHDPDFGAACAVSGADGRVVLGELPEGSTTVQTDRGLQLFCSLPSSAPAPHVLTLPEGVDVSGIVRDADGRPAAGAGIWLCREPRTPSEGGVVARTGADGRFALRGVQANAFLGAVRDGSIPSLLQVVGSLPREAELVLGGQGARVKGRVLGLDDAPIAGAVVRIARQPRANFHMPGGREMPDVHPCAVAHTDADGAFALADLPTGPLQVLVRAPRHCTGLESIVLASGVERRLELRLPAGIDVEGDVRDQGGAAIAGASVLARGVVRSAWAMVYTAPEGSFALAGLDPGRVMLVVDAPGFAPSTVPVPRDGGRIAVVLQPHVRIALRLLDTTGAPAKAPEWELGACRSRAGRPPMPEPLEPDGEGFAAAGELAAGPFVVRARGTQVWLRAEPAAEDPHLLHVPAEAGHMGPLVLSLPGTTPEQREGVLLVVERDGIQQTIVPADASAALLDFGRVPIGDNRAVFFSRTGLLPAIDLGLVAVEEEGAPVTVDVPEYGWLRYRLQRTDREPVVQCAAFVADRRGLVVPLTGASGRIALAAGRHQLWASSLSFATVGHAFAVTSAQETEVDLELSPGKVRHVAFRLPDEADPRQCRARVRPMAEASGSESAPAFPMAGRGFDTTPDGLCYTTVVLGEGDYVLDVQCGGRAFHCGFAVAGEDGVAQPIEVALAPGR